MTSDSVSRAASTSARVLAMTRLTMLSVSTVLSTPPPPCCWPLPYAVARRVRQRVHTSQRRVHFSAL